MAADYDQVLKDLDEQVAKLEAEIATLKAGRPTIVVLRNKYPSTMFAPIFAPPVAAPYANLGPTDAIPLVLKGIIFPLSTSAIADKLGAGGVKSNAQDFVRSVSATLGQLRDKGIVVKVGDGWRLKTNEDAFKELVEEQEREKALKEVSAVTFSASV
jgi:hypothetical protein